MTSVRTSRDQAPPSVTVVKSEARTERHRERGRGAARARSAAATGRLRLGAGYGACDGQQPAGSDRFRGS